MITESMVYWITRLDNLISFFTGVTVFIGIGGLWFLVYATIEELIEKPLKYWIAWFVITFISVSGLVLTPTTKEAVAIYTIPAISRNKNVQEIPANTAKFINEKLQEWINDVTKEEK